MIIGKGKPGEKFRAASRSGAKALGAGRIRGLWKITCRDKHGRVKWIDTIENIIVNTGLDHLLDVALSAGSQITTWYVGLTDGTPTVAAGDTIASHVGWVEVTDYDEANRVAFVEAGAGAVVVEATIAGVKSNSFGIVGDSAV